MLSRIISASFTLVVGAYAMDCTQAIGKLGALESDCGKQCKEENAEDGLPKCEKGQKERGPASCKNEKCRSFLSSVDDKTLEAMIKGFEGCTGHLQGYAVYASMGVDYLKVVMKQASLECDQADALQATMSPADTCSGAVWLALLGPDTACPRACDKEESEDLPTCRPGQSEYDQASCGASSCGNFIEEIDDDALGNLAQGLAACATDPNEAVRVYANYAAGAGDSLKMRIQQLAEGCGHKEKVKFAAEPKDTCMGAFGVIRQFDLKCPKQCEHDGDEMRNCTDKEPERVESTCGFKGCQDLLADVKNNTDALIKGLNNCLTVPNMQAYAGYANVVEAMARGMASQCGFNYDDIYDKTVPAPVPVPGPAPVPSCITISAEDYRSAINKGYEPRKCH